MQVAPKCGVGEILLCRAFTHPGFFSSKPHSALIDQAARSEIRQEVFLDGVHQRNRAALASFSSGMLCRLLQMVDDPTPHQFVHL